MGAHHASENRKARLKRWLKNEQGRERAALARAAGGAVAKPKAAAKPVKAAKPKTAKTATK